MWKIPLFKMSFNANKLENSGKDRGKCGFYRFWTGNSLIKKYSIISLKFVKNVINVNFARKKTKKYSKYIDEMKK